jgi:hypothetical protein
MIDRGLSVLRHRKGLALHTFVASLLLDLVRGPGAGVIGLITIGWLLRYRWPGVVVSVAGLALSTVILVVQTTMWTFLYHTDAAQEGGAAGA